MYVITAQRKTWEAQNFHDMDIHDEWMHTVVYGEITR